MTLQEIKAHYGVAYTVELISVLPEGTKKSVLYQWTEQVPYKWQRYFNKKTKGILKIDPIFFEQNAA